MNLKHFAKPRKRFLASKGKTDEKSLSLEFCHFTGYNDRNTRLTQTQLHVNCTNTQRSVTATLTTLTHITSSQRYLAAHNCITSLQRSARTVRKLLARASRVIPFRHWPKYLRSILNGYLQSIVSTRNTPRKPRYITFLKTE